MTTAAYGNRCLVQQSLTHSNSREPRETLKLIWSDGHITFTEQLQQQIWTVTFLSTSNSSWSNRHPGTTKRCINLETNKTTASYLKLSWVCNLCTVVLTWAESPALAETDLPQDWESHPWPALLTCAVLDMVPIKILLLCKCSNHIWTNKITLDPQVRGKLFSVFWRGGFDAAPSASTLLPMKWISCFLDNHRLVPQFIILYTHRENKLNRSYSNLVGNSSSATNEAYESQQEMHGCIQCHETIGAPHAFFINWRVR